MPFPYSTLGTFTYQNYSYDYTDTVENLMLNNSFNVGSYPDGMFWGGISKYDVPYAYPATAAYDFDAQTITIKDLYAGIPGVEIPRTQISYCYVPTVQSSTSPFTTGMINWQLNNGITDMTNQKYLTLSNFTTRVRGSLLASKIPLNKIIFCPYVYYFNLADWNAGNTAITRQQTSIEQWETWENNNETSDKILVGFGIGECGYIYSNTRVINAGWQSTNYYNFPDNGLFGTVIQSPLSTGFSYTNFNIYIASSGGDRTKYALARESASHEDYYYATVYSNKIYIDSNNVYLPFYNGEVTFDISELLAINTKNTYWRKPYTQGDNYLIGGHTSQEFQWASVTFQGEIYRVYDKLDDLLKYIASFGRAFCGSMPQRYQHEIAGIIDDLIFAPVLDDNKVYHGEYTRGLANATNPFFTFDDSTDTTYEPTEQGDEPPSDERENIGDKITRPASIGVGGTNGFVTQYALNRADVAQLGALLWTSFVDQDYWQNYLFSLALDTGTFQLSGLLNFFVSMKVYPFSLINVAGYRVFGQDMYIGTGIIPLHFSTNIGVLSSYCDYISGGYIDIPRYFNDYRDYINTEISLYLPFCGTVQLNPGDVIGNRIDIQYAIDFATGGCIAYVDLTTGDGAGYPVGALPGQIGADIPLTATAAGEVAARFIGDGLNVAGMIGGEVSRTASGVAGALGGNPSGGSGGGSMFAGVAGMYGGAGAAMAVDLAPGLARQGLQMLQRGAVGAPMLSGGRGFAAFGAPSRPYVQIRRGIYPEVSGLGTVSGLPAAGTYTIGSLSGFVQGDAKVDGLSCPDNEKQKIRALLASGIYV